eukprot:scaffold455_cov160-Pinguiococcus_pyrenoidosus.AAC.7
MDPVLHWACQKAWERSAARKERSQEWVAVESGDFFIETLKNFDMSRVTSHQSPREVASEHGGGMPKGF